ncbi:HAD family hydrolase [Mesorhizobium sp.]|uniref:HAD family hydrolase n=1 Tax=Mesorhizobium sp. TaxID=1871066 RepID=UPI0012037C01|nr:HAD family hydrolase [Mesorhizobium sp.]TIS55043.1 MAG: HAD family hydrolase [Mesorhizobium sp.]TIS92964.1 MAG: HAD family hydrolase [Mesorhizobium sp.]
MLPIRVIFDLDDTLYLERDFARSGFAAAGDWLHRELNIPGLAETCQRIFTAGRRSRVFNEALELLRVEADPALVDLLVDIYRTHEPTIALTADAARYLACRPRDFLAGLITDGPSGTQQAKVRALGLERALDFIVYTDALGHGYGKPHPRAFELVEAWAAPYGLPLAYVADNPSKDFVTPRERGWWTVQLDRPERVNHFTAPSAAHEAHTRITSLDELDACLDDLQSASGSIRTSSHRHAGALVAFR